MDNAAYKVCTTCGAEYSAEAMVCADCGGKLEFRTEDGSDALGLPEEEATFLVRVDAIGYLRTLAGTLGRNGIRSVVMFMQPRPNTPPSQAPAYGLYVTDEDAPRAREIDRERWLRDAPAEAATFKYEEQELQGVCPACSTKIPENAAECPECGLMVNPEADMATCPECDAVVGDEVNRCPNCGVEFE